MGTMFILISVGCYLKKKNIIKNSGKETIMDLILTVILPCNILKAYCVDLGDGMIENFIIIFAISIFVQLLSFVIAKFAYNMYDDRKKAVFQYATICSNSGFMGNPVIEGVYGMVGLTYNSIFLIPLRIMMWSTGVSFFSNQSNKTNLMKRIATHPCMVSTYLGLLIMFTPLEIPSLALGAITSCSNSCTALTMIYIGTIVADVKFTELFDKDQLYYSFIRLIIMPLFVFVLCKLFNIDELITAICVILTGMPAGSTTSLLASKYDGDVVVSTKCVVISTIISIITLPMWCYIVSI